MTVLILMRHGAAAMLLPDADRPLTDDGVAEAAATGAWLRETGLAPDLALVSSARRTRETFAATGVDCPAEVLGELYNCEPEDVFAAVNAVCPDAETLLVVGHFPAIPEVAHLLAPGADVPGFSTGTVAAFTLTPGPIAPGSGTLLDSFSP
ncbi:SixA phosphatase family protein [Tsukamurella soli]|uniref:Histidine phosphatase family protein n=1 Tax=Tsukamurella soli TaxID=644556 RepID=A0ABP8KAD9_9ACTN